jgi:AcrR family transcriptional regulator
MRSDTQEIRARTPGRPREFDIDDALDSAVRIFCERGFHGTSVSDLTEAMNLTAGSIYKAFKDKRAVFLAALDHQMSQRSIELREALASASSGRDKLRAALGFYVDVSHGAEGRQGCLVVGTAVELSSFDAEIAQRVTASLQGREKLLAELIEQGQADGSIAQGIAVNATARCMLCLLQGMRVVGKTSPNRAEMLAAADVAMKLLDM